MPLNGPFRPPLDGNPPKQVVLLLHGVGAYGQQLIDFAEPLGRRLPGAAFHAPDAPYPCDLGPFGRQWFSLADRSDEALLEGLERVTPVLLEYADGLLERYGLARGDLALLGFSQGCMTALHAGLSAEPGPRAILGYCGYLAGAETLDERLRCRPPVMPVAGLEDTVVPPERTRQAAEALSDRGLDVRMLERPGVGHGIDDEGLKAGERFLAAAFNPPTVA